jgi:hypothetical protein
MTSIGRNAKIVVAEEQRSAVVDFYAGTLGCERMSPLPELDVFQFADGFSLGVYYAERSSVLSPELWMRAPWLELLVDDIGAVRGALAAQGIEPFEYHDREHDYFQGPGGLVFRLAPAA